MNLNPALQTLVTFPGRLKQRVLGMFNLNDPRWGRDDDKSAPEDSNPKGEPDNSAAAPDKRPKAQGPNQGPPDLDELWRDFNRKLGGLFGGNKNAGVRGRGTGNLGGGGNGGSGGGFQPDMKSAGIGAGLIAGWPY